MTTPSQGDVRPRMLLLAFLIGAVAYGLAWLLPFAADARPAAAAAVLGTTALVTSLWLTGAMPIGAASLVPVVLLPLSGAVPMQDVVRGYGHPILWLFGGGFVLAQAIETWGLHRRLALTVLRWVGPHPRRIVLGFFLVATVVSLWISNTSVALMLLPIGWAIVDRTVAAEVLPKAAARNFAAGVMLAIAYGASIGGMGSPIGTAPNALFLGNYAGLVQRGAPPISFLQWLLAFAPFALLLSWLFGALMARWILPIPGGRLAGGDELVREARTQPPMSRPERRVAWLFAAAVLLWVTRGDVQLGDGAVIRGWAHWLLPEGASGTFVPDGVVAIGVAITAFLIPSGVAAAGEGGAGGDAGAAGGSPSRGQADRRPRLMDWETARQLPFDILFLLGAGIAMADAFAPTGLSLAFGALLAPLIGSVPPLLLVAILCFAILLLSEVASNTAVAALFLPILMQGALAAHLDPRVLMLPAALAASCGFMLPIATPPNTIVFASRHVTIGQMARAGFALDLVSIGLLIVVLWFWVFPLLGIDPGVEPAWLQPK
ncbi:MAG: SLC13 family permease [Planctomycetota bacterium]